ncbi:hypothetical protein SNEBB_007296 [Seison nebaliae]|nr:hypothetical protein SNEBB_007296 [Seison nebaliae]
MSEARNTINESAKPENVKVPENNVCADHNCTLEFFCKNCNVFLCGECVLLTNDHSKHIVNTIEEIRLIRSEIISSQIQSSKKLIDSYENVLKELNYHFDENQSLNEFYKSKLEQIEKEQLFLLKKCNSTNNSQLDGMKTAVTCDLKLIEERIQHLKKLIDNNNFEDIITQYKRFSHKTNIIDNINLYYDEFRSINLEYNLTYFPKYESFKFEYAKGRDNFTNETKYRENISYGYQDLEENIEFYFEKGKACNEKVTHRIRLEIRAAKKEEHSKLPDDMTNYNSIDYIYVDKIVRIKVPFRELDETFPKDCYFHVAPTTTYDLWEVQGDLIQKMTLPDDEIS